MGRYFNTKPTNTSLLVTLFTLFICHWSNAQEENTDEHQQQHNSEHHEQGELTHHRHSLSMEIGHSHISEGSRNGEKTWLTVPSWALNYNYHFNHQWSIGLHSDVIIEQFQIAGGHDEEVVERSFPLSLVVATMYKPIHYLGIIAGAGAEYAPEETFTVIRVGLEPSIEISHKWEVIFSMVFDFKVDAYDSWSMGAGIARLF